MVGYWFKNRFLYDVILAILLAALLCLAFVYPTNVTYSNILNENAIYLNSNIDFQIPNPSTEQLNNIQNEPFVKNTFGYYLTKVTATGSENSKVNFLMSDDIDKISFTMYNDTMLIEQDTRTSDFAFLDETAANALNVKCGDEVSIVIAGSTLKFTVSSIYKANTLFKEGTVLVEYAGNAKNVYETNTTSTGYAGAFIEANNISECDNYLKSYIPLGRLKERSEFESDSTYNAYNNAIMEGNYSNEITSFCELRTTASQEFSDAEIAQKRMAIIGAITVGILYLIMTEILRSRKSENRYFGEVRKNKKSIKSYRFCSLIVSVGVFVAIALLIEKAFCLSCSIIIPIICVCSIICVSFIINLIQDKKYL